MLSGAFGASSILDGIEESLSTLGTVSSAYGAAGMNPIGAISTGIGDSVGSTIGTIQSTLTSGFQKAFPSCPNGTWTTKLAINAFFGGMVFIGILALVFSNGNVQTAIKAGTEAA